MLTATIEPEDGIALCPLKTASVTVEPIAIPMRQAAMANSAARFGLPAPSRFSLRLRERL